MPHYGENLTRGNKIIGWLIFSCLRRWRKQENCDDDESRIYAIETVLSAHTKRLRLSCAAITVSPLRVSSPTADTKRRIAATRRLTKIVQHV
jgi:hypothetical protein